MKLKTAKRWFWWHKWTSLICTAFLLLLCLTGLPLIFHEEIEHWGEAHEMSAGEKQEKASLDILMENALKARPDQVVRFLIWDDGEPGTVFVSMSDSLNAPPDNFVVLEADAYEGSIKEELKLNEGFMYIMLRLHTDMFAGIPGKLFMGLMGILFCISLISGVVLYGPIMKKYDFGMIRRDRSSRLRWLDTHNLLGIVTLIWTFVVGFTGVINTLSDIILGVWQQGQLAEMTAPYANLEPLDPGKLYSLDLSARRAVEAAPDMELSFVAMPGTAFTSKHHYAFFMHGSEALTSRLFMPALVDASNGALTDMRSMPWYVNTLFLSQPLHFGDYGGMPLKIIWALLDFLTIVILITGLYLWVGRWKKSRAQWERLEAQETKQLQKDLRYE